MKILTKAITIAVLGTTAIFAQPASALEYAPRAGDTCATEQIGVAQLDADKQNLIVCLKLQGSETPIWQAATSSRRYSLTCEDWSASGFASKDTCIMDGRWHLVYQNDASGKAAGGSLEDLKRYAEMGADIKNADTGGVHFCQTAGWQTEGDNGLFVCLDGARVAGTIFLSSYTLNDGNIALGAGLRRTDGKRIASNILPKSASDATPRSQTLMIDGGMAFNWFVRF